MPPRCSSGSVIARPQQTSLTTMTFLNSSTFELRHQNHHHLILPGGPASLSHGHHILRSIPLVSLLHLLLLVLTHPSIVQPVKKEKHPLYACTKFRTLSHDDMMSIVKSNKLCLNCMRPGQYARECTSSHRCKRCQRPHHTLLHVETKEQSSPPDLPPTTSVSNHATMGLCPNLLLMTCRVLIEAPDGSTTLARALLDSGSSASFITERLAQRLRLPRSSQSTRISGIAGLTGAPSSQSVTNFQVASVHSRSRKFDVAAVIVSRVTCDLPLHPVPFKMGCMESSVWHQASRSRFWHCREDRPSTGSRDFH